MGDGEQLSLELLAYRVGQNELIQKAMQVELHDLRTEREQALHDFREEITERYLSADQTRLEFVSRRDQRDLELARRQWPRDLALLATALSSLGSLVYLVLQH